VQASTPAWTSGGEDKFGLNISSAGFSWLLNEEHTEIKLAVLNALCNALKCSPNELLVQSIVNISIEEEERRNA